MAFPQRGRQPLVVLGAARTARHHRQGPGNRQPWPHARDGPRLLLRARHAAVAVTVMIWYSLLIGAAALERLAEVVVAQSNRAWGLGRGGAGSGPRHYPVMIALHTALLAGCLVEPIALHRPF